MSHDFVMLQIKNRDEIKLDEIQVYDSIFSLCFYILSFVWIGLFSNEWN